MTPKRVTMRNVGAFPFEAVRVAGSGDTSVQLPLCDVPERRMSQVVYQTRAFDDIRIAPTASQLLLPPCRDHPETVPCHLCDFDAVHQPVVEEVWLADGQHDLRNAV